GGAAAPAEPAPAGGAARSRRRIHLSVLGIIGLTVIIAACLFCFAGPLVYHTSQVASNLAASNQPPGNGHPLGTDDNGFDILGRLMVGGQSSIEIGIAVALIATSAGVIWGAIAGFAGGIVDAAMMRIVDVILAIPALFLLLILATGFTPSVLELVVVLSFLSWQVPSRLVRGESLTLRTREFVQAVQVMGGGSARSVIRHIIPNTVSTIVVNATFQVADAILVLAVLSYLGFGLPPPAATWGGMLSNGSSYIFAGHWWQIYPVGVLIVIVVVAFNFLGDALRDVLDVRLGGGA
ncbi:MAG TPA: ABC transporter permease, partial [Streptosporangiaceae bacterium]|nr:ABC transporter permease [Streptosporangiaceae bacterium]